MPELVSIVVPCFNEEGNVSVLHGEIADVFSRLSGYGYECLFVNDGSTDGTRAELEGLAAADAHLRPVHLAKNQGQSAALMAGFRLAQGDYVLMLDGDLQNDPADFTRLIELLKEYDCVFGYRAERNDTAVRRFSGWLANRVRNRILGDTIRDSGCGLKGFRRECIEAIVPFTGVHRFLGVFMHRAGYSIRQLPVNHRPRVHGCSKYGIRNRLWRGIIDLGGVAWLRTRMFLPKELRPE